MHKMPFGFGQWFGMNDGGNIIMFLADKCSHA